MDGAILSRYEDLDVWKLAHEFVLEIYTLTKKYPCEERYRLIDQICRASSSVAMNIAEGTGRRTQKDFLNFLYIARGSLQETKYQLLLSRDLKFISNEDYEQVIEKAYTVGRLLNGLINKIGGNQDA